MLIQIPDVLNQDEVLQFRKELDNTNWVDGRGTAGYQSAKVKDNMQLPAASPVAISLGRRIIQALERNPLFISAALPAKIFPPLFNRYDGGHSFGNHVDNSIRQVQATGEQVRTDLSVTLFLSSPEEYDGGELVIDDTYGAHSVKLPAGSMVLYPSTSLHRVLPVTRGSRVCSFFWLQSIVRRDAHRSLLLELDVAIQKVGRDMPEHPALVEFTSVYHNLLREWAEV